MSEPFVGEIRMFAGTFAPVGWALCDGQLLNVSQNDALFSLLGTIYGGDGRTTFGLPDMRGRLPIHMGSGAGLSSRPIGQKSGTESVTLNTNQLPSHPHTFQASTDSGNESNPSGEVVSQALSSLFIQGAPGTALAAGAITSVGGSREHTNIRPYLCLNFIIALFGIYPSRQ